MRRVFSFLFFSFLVLSCLVLSCVSIAAFFVASRVPARGARWRVERLAVAAAGAEYSQPCDGARLVLRYETPFSRHFIRNTINLPRQARDKHRETQKREMRFSAGYASVVKDLLTQGADPNAV
jgi:hypothetical protein